MNFYETAKKLWKYFLFIENKKVIATRVLVAYNVQGNGAL